MVTSLVHGEEDFDNIPPIMETVDSEHIKVDSTDIFSKLMSFFKPVLMNMQVSCAGVEYTLKYHVSYETY